MATGNYPNFLDKTIKKVYLNMSELAMKESYFAKWARKYNTSEYSESFTSDEGIDDFASLTESGAVKLLTRAEGYKVSISADEFAGSLVVTKKMRIRSRDNTTKLGEFLAKDMKKITEAGRRHIELRTHAMLDNGFVTDGSVTTGKGTVLAPDTKAIFANDHAWNSGGSALDNKGTSKFTMQSWEAALKQMGHLTDANGAKLPVNLDTIIVKLNSDAYFRVMRLFYGKVIPTSVNVNETLTNINIYQDNKEGVKIVATPYLSSGDAWFATDSSGSSINPLIVKMVQGPTMEDKLIRENLDWVYPATISYEVGCDNMPFSWFGSDGADA